ncbi:MAG: hypothetical protein IJ048_03715 [Clostridia bacterium]|nr:hypothetical protein [Clostridia bacterium]
MRMVPIDMDGVELVDNKLEQALAVLWLELEELGTIDSMSKKTVRERRQIITGLETVYSMLSEVSERLISEIEAAYEKTRQAGASQPNR